MDKKTKEYMDKRVQEYNKIDKEIIKLNKVLVLFESEATMIIGSQVYLQKEASFYLRIKNGVIDATIDAISDLEKQRDEI